MRGLPPPASFSLCNPNVLFGKGGFCAEGAYERVAFKGREPTVPSTKIDLRNDIKV
jgi:hypothetical protein